jgi:hypothetical protein
LSVAGPEGLVFREDAVWRPGAALVEEAARAVATAGDAAAVARVFLQVGALECALLDAGQRAPEAVTDALAGHHLNGAGPPLGALATTLARWPVEGPLRVSRPEGFAYYALDPREVAQAAVGLPSAGPVVLVVGVRSVGTTLSAAVRAALVASGRRAERFSVRPEGTPYDRVTRLTDEQTARVRACAERGGAFVIVDEGPGLSGSSFLATGEALVAAGASAERVVFLGSRAVDPATLVAPDAAVRWRRFRAIAVEAARPGPERDGSGGRWRGLFWEDPARWPATWPMLERLKQRSHDGRWLVKFEGLGPYGTAVHARAEALASAGLAPRPAGPPDDRGFVAYPFPAGRPLDPGARDSSVLAALGRYCATRAALFPAPEPDPPEGLEAMARHNVAVVTGRPLPDGWRLPRARMVIADGKMQAYEWLRAPDGALLKVDGASHGDDHLYPGPTDIAWDLAGAAVEWELSESEEAALLAAYRHAAGEDPGARLAPYRIAYAAFRACWCVLAAQAAPSDELPRLERAGAHYRRTLQRALLGLSPGGGEP